MGMDRARLSKRTGATAVSDYKKEGFLPEAIVNYLMLLGWSPGGNQEVVKLESAIKTFSLKKINKAAAVFDMDKLRWINSQYLKQKNTKDLTELLIPILKENGYINEGYDSQNLESIVKLYQGRMDTLLDFLAWTDFLFVKDFQVPEDLRKEYHLAEKEKEFNLLGNEFQKIQDFNTKSTEEVFRALVAQLNIKAADLVHPVRVALTGKTVGPGLFDTMTILGKDETIKRLQQAVNR